MSRLPPDPEALAPARSLPIPVRPWGRESLPSFVARLAEANRTRHTALWRHIGLPYARTVGATLLTREATLNRLAIGRLAIMSGLPEARLRKSLPALSWSHPDPPYLPVNVPAVYMSAATAPSGTVCRQCTTKRGITRDVLAHLPLPDVICLRHRIWQASTPLDISSVPEMERAQRTLRRIRKANGPHAMACGVRDARWITSIWLKHPTREPGLNQRWETRREAVGLPRGVRTGELPAQIITHPEVAILASILAPNYTDPRHIHHTDFHPLQLIVHLRRALGLPLTGHPLGKDPILAFIRVVQDNRAKWRDPKSVMITETATPRYTQ